MSEPQMRWEKDLELSPDSLRGFSEQLTHNIRETIRKEGNSKASAPRRAWAWGSVVAATSLLLVLTLLIFSPDLPHRLSIQGESAVSLDRSGIEQAMKQANITFDNIYLITERKGYPVVLYNEGDVLFVGLLEQTRSGYKWSFGGGSKMFQEKDQLLTRAFSNLPPPGKDASSDDAELISLTFGVVNDSSIARLMIKYRDQELKEATILTTPQGRIWYCFSDTGVGYDPGVIRIDRNGRETPGWY
jgi:hypothetical protein